MVNIKQVLICALCRSNSILCESHLVPQFVGDWLKNTSATGYLRGSDKPNLRRQGTEKPKLLCFDCEQRLSKREKLFADRVFYPFQNNGNQSFVYENWLLYFAVSMAWRTSLRYFDVIQSATPKLAILVENAMETWRIFLLEENSNAGPFQHHLFFFDYLSANNSNVPDKFHWYTLRGIDTTLAYDEAEIYAYSKLPGMVFWCGIEPPERQGWEGTLILDHGSMSTPQSTEDNEFGNFLHSRVDFAAESIKKTSEKQRQQVHQTALKDPTRLKNSQSLQTYIAEEYWRKQREDD